MNILPTNSDVASLQGLIDILTGDPVEFKKNLDSIKKATNENKTALANATAKFTAAIEKEKEVIAITAAISARENGLSQRKEELDKRESELKAREESLIDRTAKYHLACNKDVPAMIAAAKARENSVCAKEKQLEKLEQTLEKERQSLVLLKKEYEEKIQKLKALLV